MVTLFRSIKRAAKLSGMAMVIVALATMTFPAGSRAAINPSKDMGTPGPGEVFQGASAPNEGKQGVLELNAYSYPLWLGIPGAGVIVRDLSGTLIAKGSTNQSGNAELKLSPGIYIVTVVADEFENWASQVEIRGGTKTATDAVMWRTDQTGAVSITAMDGVTKALLKGVQVTIYDRGGFRMAVGTTNIKGYYYVKLPANTYTFVMELDKYVAQKTMLDVIVGKDIHYDAILMPGIGMLDVHVVDTISKDPIPGANVTVAESTGKIVAQGTTNKVGTISFDLIEGRYVVTASAPNYMTMSTEVVIIAGNTTECTIPLPDNLPDTR